MDDFLLLISYGSLAGLVILGFYMAVSDIITYYKANKESKDGSR